MNIDTQTQIHTVDTNSDTIVAVHFHIVDILNSHICTAPHVKSQWFLLSALEQLTFSSSGFSNTYFLAHLSPYGNSHLKSYPLVLALPLHTRGTNLRVHSLSATLSHFIYAFHYFHGKFPSPALKQGHGCGHIDSSAQTINPQT